jgi:hypothetical protein
LRYFTLCSHLHTADAYNKAVTKLKGEMRMGCLFNCGRRRPYDYAPRPSQCRQCGSVPPPPVSNSFYGLDTDYDPYGGMVPMRRGHMIRGSYANGSCPGMMPPEDAFDNGTLFTDLLPSESADTYR